MAKVAEEFGDGDQHDAAEFAQKLLAVMFCERKGEAGATEPRAWFSQGVAGSKAREVWAVWS